VRGTVSIQHEARVCSVLTYSYGSRENTVFSVDDVVDGKLVHRGNCEWNGPGPACPDPGEAATDDRHWTAYVSDNVRWIHEDIASAAKAPPSPLGKIDPAIWPDIWPEDWFETCLTTPDYPSPDQLRPGSAAEP
jgi:hypothetical protein